MKLKTYVIQWFHVISMTYCDRNSVTNPQQYSMLHSSTSKRWASLTMVMLSVFSVHA